MANHSNFFLQCAGTIFSRVIKYALLAPTTEVTKLAEVYFNQASWQLNQEDGQLAIADTSFTNFR